LKEKCCDNKFYSEDHVIKLVGMRTDMKGLYSKIIITVNVQNM